MHTTKWGRRLVCLWVHLRSCQTLPASLYQYASRTQVCCPVSSSHLLFLLCVFFLSTSYPTCFSFLPHMFLLPPLIHLLIFDMSSIHFPSTIHHFSFLHFLSSFITSYTYLFRLLLSPIAYLVDFPSFLRTPFITLSSVSSLIIIFLPLHFISSLLGCTPLPPLLHPSLPLLPSTPVTYTFLYPCMF